ncbi:hypothetical protein F2P81_011723 [Scophthalmus maximus]|uniref:Uncharacterized protein n=1 Tax=Scophthalmus maximus TaxID=52904 RepID=A0A6A4SZJ6_SCOMX|nr:hypothetical protein F2P81_011723 [Scophthalmus maximus]
MSVLLLSTVTPLLRVNGKPTKQLSEQGVSQSPASLRRILKDQRQKLWAAHFTRTVFREANHFFRLGHTSIQSPWLRISYGPHTSNHLCEADDGDRDVCEAQGRLTFKTRVNSHCLQTESH